MINPGLGLGLECLECNLAFDSKVVTSLQRRGLFWATILENWDTLAVHLIYPPGW